MEIIHRIRSTCTCTTVARVSGTIAGICTLTVIFAGILYLRGEVGRDVFSNIFIVLAIPASVLGYVAIAAKECDQEKKEVV